MPFTSWTTQSPKGTPTMYQTRNYPIDLQLRRLGDVRRAQRRRELVGRVRLLVGRTPRPRPAGAR
jgi:hypothetical protein